MDDYFSEMLGSGNASDTVHCSRDMPDDSQSECFVPPALMYQWRIVSIIKLITASLSMITSLSVIIAIVVRQKAWRPDAHPLLMLCIADFLLASLFLVGGVLYLDGDGRGYFYAGCFAVSMLTIILLCVTAALTMTYAMFAYAHVKQIHSQNTGQPQVAEHSCLVQVLVYLLAWVVPVVGVVVPIVAVGTVYDTFSDAKTQSCRCIPAFGNIIPGAFPPDGPRSEYVLKLFRVIVVQGAVVGVSYTVTLVLIVTFYWRTLRLIRSIDNFSNISGSRQTEVAKRQKRTRNRIIAFLTVFIITALVNGILAYIVMIYHAQALNKSSVCLKLHNYGVFIVQALIVPSQGLFNAITYGWTRKTFLQALARRPSYQQVRNGVQNVVQLEGSANHQRSYQATEPTSYQESLTHTLRSASGETSRTSH